MFGFEIQHPDWCVLLFPSSAIWLIKYVQNSKTLALIRSICSRSLQDWGWRGTDAIVSIAADI